MTVASHGGEAVKVLTQDDQLNSFDVVLMDLQMPDMDGFTATRLLRGDPRLQNLPIIAMTAHALVEERQRCLDAGMNDHVRKPIDPDALSRYPAQMGQAQIRVSACIPQESRQGGSATNRRDRRGGRPCACRRQSAPYSITPFRLSLLRSKLMPLHESRSHSPAETRRLPSASHIPETGVCR